jgi:DNA modification methylase
VVAPLAMQQYMLLQRNLVYKGITWGKKLVVLIGYPLELASRLVRMFSFVGDTVLDPLAGSGTTLLASAKANRNSIGVEIEPQYCQLARTRFDLELSNLSPG